MTLIAPTDLVDAAKAIISKLNMKKGFDPLNYENPSRCLGCEVSADYTLAMAHIVAFLHSSSEALQSSTGDCS